jgi:hypothetical protein
MLQPKELGGDMSPVAEYKLLEGASVDELSDAVNMHIKDGWQPYGDTFKGKDGWFYQAVTK